MKDKYRDYLRLIHRALNDVGEYAYSHKCEGLTYDECEKLIEYTDKAIKGIEDVLNDD